jgi:ArsR family transcriptional regulator
MASPPAKSIFPPRTVTAEQAAAWFRALGDATRVEIRNRLSEGEQCVCDLTDLLETKQSLLSFHLKTLKEAEIVQDRRDRRWVYHSVTPAVLDALEQFIGKLSTRSRQLHVVRKCCD